MFVLTVLCPNNRKCKHTVSIKCEPVFDLTCGIKKKTLFVNNFKKIPQESSVALWESADCEVVEAKENERIGQEDVLPNVLM